MIEKRRKDLEEREKKVQEKNETSWSENSAYQEPGDTKETDVDSNPNHGASNVGYATVDNGYEEILVDKPKQQSAVNDHVYELYTEDITLDEKLDGKSADSK